MPNGFVGKQVTFRDMLEHDADVRVRAHFPAHQGSSLGSDRESVWQLDVPYVRKPAVDAAQADLARVCGSRRTWILTHGASQGLVTCALIVGRRTRSVAIAHNTHVAFIRGMILADLTPEYVPSTCAMPTTEEVLRYLQLKPAPYLVLTSPSYRGERLNLARISAACEQAGVGLIIDEVHGTHLAWSPDNHDRALLHHTQLVIHSPHKYCGSLVQGALIHLPLSSDVHAEEVEAAVALTSTTSCSNLIRLTVDESVRRFADSPRIQSRPAGLVLKEHLEGLRTATLHCSGSATDPWKLVLKSPKASGFELARRLLRHGVDHEFSDCDEVVLIFSPANTESDIRIVSSALACVARELEHSVNASFPPKMSMRSPRLAMRPREAYFQTSRERVQMAAAIGRVSCESVAFEPVEVVSEGHQTAEVTKSPRMPPGAPLLIPGEVIGEWHVDACGGTQSVSVVRGCD